jgi:RimJ/RimL family protein N-acetyltransferase
MAEGETGVRVRAAAAMTSAGDCLRTERLVLRRARPDDGQALYRVLSDARAMRYWSTAPHRALAETEDWLAGMIDAPAESSNDFVVERDGVVNGKAGCWRLPELGFILHPDHWGCGLAGEALEAVIASTFLRFPVSALTADVDPRNLACLRLLDRLGFVRTGRAEKTWFVNGAWADSLYLALARPGT